MMHLKLPLRLVIGALIGLSLVLQAACGGGGDDGGPSNAPPLPPPPPPVQDGVFKDSNVSGVDYVSGAQSGTTGADGGYTCETGNSIEFAVGAVSLGSAECSTLSSPPDLVASGQFDDPEAINRARFLQLLDIDQNPTNGITISDGLQQMADSWLQIDWAADLDSQLTTVFSDILSVDGRTVTAAPSSALAFAVMDAALACAYGGAFTGRFDGSNTGAVAFATGRRLSGFSQDEFLFMAFDAAEEFQLSTGGGFTMSTRSNLDSTPFDQTVIVQAQFSDPDTLSGTWNYPPENASGTLTASRLGSSSGVLRFVGDFSAFESRGVVSFNVDAEGNISGEAFDVVDASRPQLSGVLDQAMFEIQISDGGTMITADAEASIDQAGTLRVTGSWDDGSQFGGTFSTIGCLLN